MILRALRNETDRRPARAPERLTGAYAKALHRYYLEHVRPMEIHDLDAHLRPYLFWDEGCWFFIVGKHVYGPYADLRTANEALQHLQPMKRRTS